MFGIDPVELDPVETETYKKIIDIFHDVADNNTSVIDITKELIDDLKDDFIGDDSNISKVLATKLNSTIETNWTKSGGELNLTEINTSIPYDAIAVSKAIFQSLRDQINSITNEDENGTIDNEIKKADEQLKDITFDNIEIAAKSIGAIVDAIISNDNSSFEYDGVNYTVTINESSYEISNGNNTWQGSLSYKDIPQEVSVLTNSFNAFLIVKGSLPTKNNNSQTIDSNITLDYVKESSFTFKY